MSIHDHPWVVVVGSALAYDAWLIRYRGDSLSRHFAQAFVERPVRTAIGIAYLGAHLCCVLPKKLDLFLYANMLLTCDDAAKSSKIE